MVAPITEPEHTAVARSTAVAAPDVLDPRDAPASPPRAEASGRARLHPPIIASVALVVALLMLAVGVPAINAAVGNPPVVAGSPLTIGLGVTVTPASGWFLDADAYRPGLGDDLPGVVALTSAGTVVTFRAGTFDGSPADLLAVIARQLQVQHAAAPTGSSAPTSLASGLAGVTQSFSGSGGTYEVSTFTQGATGVAVIVSASALGSRQAADVASMISTMSVPASHGTSQP